MTVEIYTHDPYGYSDRRIAIIPCIAVPRQYQVVVMAAVPSPERAAFDAIMYELGMQWHFYQCQNPVAWSVGRAGKLFCGQLPTQITPAIFMDLIRRVIGQTVGIDCREGLAGAPNYAFAYFSNRQAYAHWRSYHRAIVYMPEGFWIASADSKERNVTSQKLRALFMTCDTGCGFRAFAHLAVIEPSRCDRVAPRTKPPALEA